MDVTIDSSKDLWGSCSRQSKENLRYSEVRIAWKCSKEYCSLGLSRSLPCSLGKAARRPMLSLLFEARSLASSWIIREKMRLLRNLIERQVFKSDSTAPTQAKPQIPPTSQTSHVVAARSVISGKSTKRKKRTKEEKEQPPSIPPPPIPTIKNNLRFPLPNRRRQTRPLPTRPTSPLHRKLNHRLPTPMQRTNTPPAHPIPRVQRAKRTAR